MCPPSSFLIHLSFSLIDLWFTWVVLWFIFDSLELFFDLSLSFLSSPLSSSFVIIIVIIKTPFNHFWFTMKLCFYKLVILVTNYITNCNNQLCMQIHFMLFIASYITFSLYLPLQASSISFAFIHGRHEFYDGIKALSLKSSVVQLSVLVCFLVSFRFLHHDQKFTSTRSIPKCS